MSPVRILLFKIVSLDTVFKSYASPSMADMSMNHLEGFIGEPNSLVA